MNERPILFSGPMVQAILEGRKTQTRRIVKPQPKSGGIYLGCVGGKVVGFLSDEGSVSCPYGTTGGSRLWVRETWARDDETGQILYRADDNNDTREWEQSRAESGHPRYNWRPSIYMPRSVSRVTLEITGIRVERLQEITNADARAEGPEYASPHRHGAEGMDFEPYPGKIIKDQYAKRHNTGVNDCWICAYRMIWESINGPGSWDANPWVWVVEFKVVT